MSLEIKNDLASISLYSDPFNKRIRIDDYSGSLQEVLVLTLKNVPEWTEKLILKARENDFSFFQAGGFTKEAFIHGYFNGMDVHFLVKYFSKARAYSPKQADEQRIVEKIMNEERLATETDKQTISIATTEDIPELSMLYSSIFKIYPTPLGDQAHVRKTMAEGTLYVVIREQHKIISVASAEINRRYLNAELTDCATTPEAEGKGHMKKLLSKLEEILRMDNIQCLYSIARAESYSMNKAFYQLGFTYGGMMINNCFIYSGLEDMNVWYKSVRV